MTAMFHAIVTGGFALIIPFAIWLIARDLRREWRSVREALGHHGKAPR
ncbi:hypothetical protein O4H52_03220 [Sphingomonadaceae bacterium G21617-S1]|nr:hypothetical protein [Sphingomonadaceae bacterium G21617-S1]